MVKMEARVVCRETTIAKRRRTLNDKRVMLLIKECYVWKLQQLKIDFVDKAKCGKYLKSMFVCIRCYRNTEKCVVHLETIS